jgi:hypothetical protein
MQQQLECSLGYVKFRLRRSLVLESLLVEVALFRAWLSHSERNKQKSVQLRCQLRPSVFPLKSWQLCQEYLSPGMCLNAVRLLFALQVLLLLEPSAVDFH